MILYLHGFRSSPHSFKARVLAQTMQDRGKAASYFCPQLPASPAAAIALVSSIAQQYVAQELTLIGSSLGGYYATWLAQQIGCRAVLLNPAVNPSRDLEDYVGLGTYYHSNEPFEFKPEYVAELNTFQVSHITQPERYFLIAATGDEVLDWREMVAHYPQAKQLVIQGGDHGISAFAEYVDIVLAFCGISLCVGKQ